MAKKKEQLVKKAQGKEAVKIKQELIERPRRGSRGTAETPITIDEYEGHPSGNASGNTSIGEVHIQRIEGMVGVNNVRGDVYIQSGQSRAGRSHALETNIQAKPKKKEAPRVNFLEEFEREIDEEVERKYATLDRQQDTVARTKDDEPPRRSARLKSHQTSEPVEEQGSKDAKKGEEDHREGAANKGKGDKGKETTSERGETKEKHTKASGSHTLEIQLEDTREQTKGARQEGQKKTEAQQAQHTNQREGSEGGKTLAQVVMTEPAIVRRRHSFRLQFSFVTTGSSSRKVSIPAAQASHLQKALQEFLMNAQAIDSTAVINTWKEGDKCRTIQRKEDVPGDIRQVLKFLRPPPGTQLKSGTTNWYWGVRVSTDSDMNEFLQVWEEEKRRAPKERKPAAVRKAPLQAEEWHESGLFIGSTANQVIQPLLDGIREELQDHTIGLNWQSIAFPGSRKMWDRAKEAGKADGPRAKFAMAPMALQVLVDSKSKLRRTMKYLYQKYGQVAMDGSWPSLPDGSRLRFIPNFQFTKDAMGKKRIQKRMQLQVQMHYQNVVFPIPVKDPTALIEVDDEMTTVGKLVLEEMCVIDNDEEQVKEPYFRHFVERWTPQADQTTYDVAVHEHMTKYAKQKIRHITKDLVAKYGDAIKPHLALPEEGGMETAFGLEGYDEEDNVSLGDSDDDSMDMYMNGRGTQFIFEGLDKVNTTEGPGPGGAQSNIAFTVNTIHTTPPNQMTRSERAEEATEEKANQNTEAYQGSGYHKDKAKGGTKVTGETEGGWKRVTRGRNSEGNAAPHRKNKAPEASGQAQQ